MHGRTRRMLHLELFSVQRGADKLKYLAGSESAMGAFINDVEPEAHRRIHSRGNREDGQ
jgi:UDPglucose--hexose-1-phosphate uridylyltransferase